MLCYTMPMKEITSITTKSVQDLEISDCLRDTVEMGYMEADQCFYDCEFSYEGKSYEGVIEAVRVWDEGSECAFVEWEGDTINNVEENKSK